MPILLILQTELIGLGLELNSLNTSFLVRTYNWIQKSLRGGATRVTLNYGFIWNWALTKKTEIRKRSFYLIFFFNKKDINATCWQVLVTRH
jgi:hypothetical protein